MMVKKHDNGMQKEENETPLPLPIPLIKNFLVKKKHASRRV